MKVLSLLARLCAVLAGVILTGITLVTCVSLIGRNTIGTTLVGDYELTAVAAGAAVALFLPWCQVRRENIIVDFFTARMLLLLESLPLYNDALYRDVIRAMISSYYRDYSDHEKNFRPIFFQNDIMRYWKTMCLNYEHRRNRLPDDPIKHAEFHLKNFRLKFSRLLTCFSMIIAVVHLSRRAVLRDSELLALVLASPWQRLIEVARDTGSRSLLGQMVDLYVWFLDSTAAPKEQCARWKIGRAHV